MGGLVFASGPSPLFTPRMSPEVYRRVLQHCRDVLGQLFVVFAVPIEAPAKKDYGDVDIFLAWERSVLFPTAKTDALIKSLHAEPRDAASQLLGAVRVKKQQSANATLAIPWPKGEEDVVAPQNHELSTRNQSNGEDGGVDEKKDEQPRDKYVQVDLHVSPCLEHLQWMLFKHAHGDLWNVLGSIIRPFGLTIDEEALWIRIPEVEKLNKKAAKVELTREPTEILGFLGLQCDGAHWEQPFETVEALFEFAASCRLFSIRQWAPREKETDAQDIRNGEQYHEDGAAGNSVEAEKETDTTATATATTATAIVDKSKLRSNERRKMNTRPVFEKWIEEFIPGCRAEGRYVVDPDRQPSRDSVREDAFARFAGVERQYDRQLLKFRRKRQLEVLWKDVIKPCVPEVRYEKKQQQPSDGDDDGVGGGSINDKTNILEVEFRRCAVNALKKIVVQGDASFGITAPAHLRDEQGLFDEDAVRRWVTETWREVGGAAQRKSRQQYAQKLAVDTDREKLKMLADTTATTTTTEDGSVLPNATPVDTSPDTGNATAAITTTTTTSAGTKRTASGSEKLNFDTPGSIAKADHNIDEISDSNFGGIASWLRLCWE